MVFGNKRDASKVRVESNRHEEIEEKIDNVIEEELDNRSNDVPESTKKVSIDSKIHNKEDYGVKPAVHYVDAQRTLLFGIIIDGTLSFSKVYPKVFSALEDFFKHQKLSKNDFKNVIMKYAITIIRGENAENVVFADGSFFTNSEDEVLKYLEKKMSFKGGNASGRENMTEAINKQMQAFMEYPNSQDYRHIYKGLLIFTDSMPEENKLREDFSEKYDSEKCGLRFAKVFSYGSKYRPDFYIVDRDGAVPNNGRNNITYYDIREHLLENKDVKNLLKAISESIFNSASMPID